MNIPKEMKREWEHRLPDFSGKWSHWKFTGDNELIAVIDGMNLFDALNLIEENFEKYITIKATRVTVDSSGAVLLEEKQKSEISNRLYDTNSIERYCARKA